MRPVSERSKFEQIGFRIVLAILGGFYLLMVIGIAILVFVPTDSYWR